MNRPRRLPLLVIGGFLGAGKTTLLNRLLADDAGCRRAVLVNDFGAVNIDASLVAARSGDAIALTNGCVCCSIGGDLSGALMRVLDDAARFDAVVVEASGVSDPWRIAQIGLADPGLSLDGVVVLVDAAAVLEQAADPLLADTLRRQLQGADLVVLNKTDLVDERRREAARNWVRSAAGGVEVIDAVDARVPMELLGGAGPTTAGKAQEHGHGHGNHCGHDHAAHDRQFETWTGRPSQPLPAQALRAALRDMPAGVLRLKGVLATDEHAWAEIQFAGRHGSLRSAFAPPAEEGGVVVAIGLSGRLPRPALDALFAGA
jgi:G3E family GTPase